MFIRVNAILAVLSPMSTQILIQWKEQEARISTQFKEQDTLISHMTLQKGDVLSQNVGTTIPIVLAVRNAVFSTV